MNNKYEIEFHHGNLCPVCAADHGTPPWGENGNDPNYDTCLCCGIEFGRDDLWPEDIEYYRKNWLKHGATWTLRKYQPEGWSLRTQLSAIFSEEEVNNCIAQIPEFKIAYGLVPTGFKRDW